MVKVISPKIAVSIFVGILVFLILTALVAVYFILKPGEPEVPVQSQGKTPEEILNSLTAPSGAGTEISEEVLESLTAPGGGEASGDIINSLTAPQ